MDYWEEQEEERKLRLKRTEDFLRESEEEERHKKILNALGQSKDEAERAKHEAEQAREEAETTRRHIEDLKEELDKELEEKRGYVICAICGKNTKMADILGRCQEKGCGKVCCGACAEECHQKIFCKSHLFVCSKCSSLLPDSKYHYAYRCSEHIRECRDCNNYCCAIHRVEFELNGIEKSVCDACIDKYPEIKAGLINRLNTSEIERNLHLKVYGQPRFIQKPKPQQKARPRQVKPHKEGFFEYIARKASGRGLFYKKT